MTSPQDIIGIVKDLQGRGRGLLAKDLAIFDLDLRQAFPAIAQALLFAVEALEKGIVRLESNYPDGSQTAIDELAEALSRIRAL